MGESTARDVEFPNNWNATAPAEITNKIFDDIMDDFEVTPASDSNLDNDDEESESEESTEYVSYNDKLKDKPLEKPKPELTRLEAHILRSLARALSDADGEKVEEMLSILAEHPNSIRRVLQELKHIKEASDDLKTLRVNWEQGTDQNNEQFVRLRMTRTESPSSRVEVVIGSDGRNRSVRNNKEGTQELQMSTGLEAVRPVEALRQLSVKQELLRQATERRPRQQQ